jgi:signal transduction histidine kinase
LKPVVGDEVYRIAGEALRNALRHAAARQIAVEIRYEDRRFRVRVRDDGRGFDQKAVPREQPDSHFGLRGMHERAEKIGGGLDVWSKLGVGTEIVLSIPAAIAYAPSGVEPDPRSSGGDGRNEAVPAPTLNPVGQQD